MIILIIIINNDNNGNDYVINTILINKWVVEYKENMEGARQKKNIDLCYVDYFDYKFTVITKVDLFEDIMDTTHVDKKSFMFTSHYFKIQLKINNLSIIISCVDFNREWLKFIFKININLNWGKKKDWIVLIGYLQD